MVHVTLDLMIGLKVPGFDDHLVSEAIGWADDDSQSLTKLEKIDHKRSFPPKFLYLIAAVVFLKNAICGSFCRVNES